VQISESNSEPHWTEARKELRDWFKRNAPSLGELYEGALKMIYAEKFPGRTRFIAHSVREIRNRLPEVVEGYTKGRTQLHYKNRLDEIAIVWKIENLPIDGIFPITNSKEENEPLNDLPIPRILFQKIAILIKDHEETREKPNEAATRLFETIAPYNQKAGDILGPIIMQWRTVTDWFMKKAHDSGRQDNDIDGDEFLRQFLLFEGILGALIGSFYKTIEGLDEILEDTNSFTS